MAQNHFLAGVGRALLFDGNNLIGVAKTLTENTFNFGISSEEIRGGQGNALWGKYFHDSSMNVTLTSAMFKIEYIAATLGVDVQMGGLVVYESPAAGDTVGKGGVITLTNTPVAFDGTMIGWYKKPTDQDWSIGNIVNNTLVIPNATVGDSYCVKYFYQSEASKFIQIKSQYVPKVLHLVIMNDLFSGDPKDVAGSTTRYGRLITDIPSFQLDGSQDLSLTATSAATVSLSGSALAIESGDICEEDPYYGTMTEYIEGAVWQDSVIALAVENAEMELQPNASETAIVRVIYNGAIAAQRKDNSNFTFTVKDGSAATVDNQGVVTAQQSGTALIEVTLTGYANVEPAYIYVTV